MFIRIWVCFELRFYSCFKNYRIKPFLCFSAEDDEAEKRHLHHFGLRERGADGEVAERKQPDQQKREDDLRQPAQQAVNEEFGAYPGHGEAAEFDQPPHVDHRERPGVEEPHIGRAGGTEPGLQVLLQRRAQVLEERRGNGEGNPEFEHERRL